MKIIMTEEIKAILQAQATAKEAQKTYDNLVADYITKNVDPKSWDSLDKAILALPESKNKLKLYDMMYDLENPS